MNGSVRFASRLAVLLCLGMVAHAAVPLNDAEVESARARIEAERERQNAEFGAQDDACLTRFAVTDCQNEVAKRRRVALARLKREEIALNESVRRQRAQEQVMRTQEKKDARAAQNASLAGLAPQDRGATQQDKQRKHPQPVSVQERHAKVVEVVPAGVLAERRKAYAEKQQAQEKKRQEHAKRLQEQGAPKPGLPIPP